MKDVAGVDRQLRKCPFQGLETGFSGHEVLDHKFALMEAIRLLWKHWGRDHIGKYPTHDSPYAVGESHPFLTTAYSTRDASYAPFLRNTCLDNIAHRAVASGARCQQPVNVGTVSVSGVLLWGFPVIILDRSVRTMGQ